MRAPIMYLYSVACSAFGDRMLSAAADERKSAQRAEKRTQRLVRELSDLVDVIDGLLRSKGAHWAKLSQARRRPASRGYAVRIATRSGEIHALEFAATEEDAAYGIGLGIANGMRKGAKCAVYDVLGNFMIAAWEGGTVASGPVRVEKDPFPEAHS